MSYDVENVVKADIRIKELEAENATLRAALEAVEFVKIWDKNLEEVVYKCPVCGILNDEGEHLFDCGTGQALAATAGNK